MHVSIFPAIHVNTAKPLYNTHPEPESTGHCKEIALVGRLHLVRKILAVV